MRIRLLSCALGLSIFAQTNVSVYVTGLDSTQETTRRLIEHEIVTGVIARSDYNAMEHTDLFNKLIEERNHSISNVDEQEILELGKQNGSKIVCFVRISPFQNTFYIQLKMQNTNNAKVLAAAGEGSTLNSLEEIIRACESATEKLMNLLNARREEARKKQQEQERIDQQNALAEAQQAQEEQERQRKEEEEIDEMLEESLNNLGNSIKKLVETINSYMVVVRNHKNYPCKVILDGHELGIVNPYKTEYFQVPLEWYGMFQAVQTQGYIISPTIFSGRIPPQKKQGTYILDLK